MSITPVLAPQLTVSVRLVWPFRAANQALGIDADAIWELEGVDRAKLLDPDTRVPWDAAQRLLRWSAQATQVSDLGLRAAELAEPGLFDLPEYAARSQPTLRQAYDCIRRLYPLLSDVGEVSWEDRGETSLLALQTPTSSVQHSATAEFTLAYLVLSARRFTGLADLAPVEVHLKHPAPGDPRHHQALFKAPVRFGMQTDQLVLSRAQLDSPLLHADAHLSDLLDRVADRLLRETVRSPTLAERVRTLIAQRMGSGRASAKDVARELGMVQRTLHRHLAQGGVTFRQLSDDVRRHLALAYLEERRLSLSDIAYLLGFSGVPAFHRAFKRWTGTTPGKYLASRHHAARA